MSDQIAKASIVASVEGIPPTAVFIDNTVEQLGTDSLQALLIITNAHFSVASDKRQNRN
jgi:hypothetical protein